MHFKIYTISEKFVFLLKFFNTFFEKKEFLLINFNVLKI